MSNPHGTNYSYCSLQCRCMACRAAHAASVRTYRRRKGVKPRPASQPHGLSTYNNRGCRCDICREALRVYGANRREKLKGTHASSQSDL